MYRRFPQNPFTVLVRYSERKFDIPFTVAAMIAPFDHAGPLWLLTLSMLMRLVNVAGVSSMLIPWEGQPSPMRLLATINDFILPPRPVI